MRQIVLDTETTGLEPSQGHRIIEIGCVEVVDRRLTGNNYHVYLQPDRVIDQGAIDVHGITNEFLEDKPRFHDVVNEFMAFIEGAELVIHNAPFDIGFIDHELNIYNQAHQGEWKKASNYCSVLDTLVMARKMHPGKRNTLDALCKRYDIDNSQRTLHGALLDAEILADVYLMMTGGQSSLLLTEAKDDGVAANQQLEVVSFDADRPELPIIRATADECEAHEQVLEKVRGASENCIWDQLDTIKH